jgi:RimJ/RimL family protein N-acetyltransferase
MKRPPRAPPLETDRFRLLPLTRRAISRASLRWSDDAEVMAGFGQAAGGWTLRRWRRRFRRYDGRKRCCYGIYAKNDGRLIGYHVHEINLQYRHATLLVLIGERDWWGRGAVIEVRSAVLDLLFQRLGIRRVSSTVHARNLPSIYNYRRLGFRQEGILREAGLGADDNPVDLVVFALLAREWRRS